MRGILADVNCEGQVERIVELFGQDWRMEYWQSLNLSLLRFDDVALLPEATDREVWLVCRREDLVLVTGSRNAADDDALQSVIAELNQPDSNPVFTIGNPRRVLVDSDYAHRTADSLLEYLVEIERYLGTGRLYIP